MKILASLVALFVIVAGVAGMIAPDRVMSLASYVLTPAGLLGIAALRISIGVVLIMVAPATRAPRTLQVCGAVILLAGLVTPLFGVERARAVFDWEVAQGPTLIRAGAAAIVAIGGLFAFALTPGDDSLTG
jgi:hypothetical protein